jgi:hypothetical protein
VVARGSSSTLRASIAGLGRRVRDAVRRSPTRRPPAGDEPLRFAYAPELDGDPDPGEVVWAWVPYEEDPTQGKDRPVVIVGTRGHRLVAVPLTSRRDDRDPQVPVGSGPWDREGRPSWARLDRMLELDRHAVRREGAVLPRERFDAVVAGAVRVHAAR